MPDSLLSRILNSDFELRAAGSQCNDGRRSRQHEPFAQLAEKYCVRIVGVFEQAPACRLALLRRNHQ